MPNPSANLPTDANGHVMLHPVHSTSTFALAQTAIGLSIEIEHRDGRREVIALALHPNQAIAIGLDLQEAAHRILQQPTPGRSGQN